MRPEELRIGNLINGHYDDELDVVKVIGYDPWENFYWVEGSMNAEFYEEFSPIQLTEEWLIKFGFDQKMIMLNSPDRYLVLSAFVDQKRMYFYLEDTFGGLFDLNFIEYVHQLQNLYHCLTCQELTIK